MPKMHIHPRQHHTRASIMMPMWRCSNFFAMQTIATHLATWTLPKKPSESTPAHGAVAAVLSHGHYLTIRLLRGTSNLSMFRTRSLATEPIPHKISFLPLFSQAFPVWLGHKFCKQAWRILLKCQSRHVSCVFGLYSWQCWYSSYTLSQIGKHEFQHNPYFSKSDNNSNHHHQVMNTYVK